MKTKQTLNQNKNFLYKKKKKKKKFRKTIKDKFP